MLSCRHTLAFGRDVSSVDVEYPFTLHRVAPFDVFGPPQKACPFDLTVIAYRPPELFVYPFELVSFIVQAPLASVPCALPHFCSISDGFEFSQTPKPFLLSLCIGGIGGARTGGAQLRRGRRRNRRFSCGPECRQGSARVSRRIRVAICA